MALYKNLLLVGTFAIKTELSQLFVTLHLPLPVIIIFLPTRLFFSNKVTSAPHKAALPAHIIPAAPAPITITLVGVIRLPLCNAYLFFIRVFIINAIVIPNPFKVFKGFYNIVLFFDNSCNNQGINKA